MDRLEELVEETVKNANGVIGAMIIDSDGLCLVGN
jgi:predicted regulator of Ras-like GTPase activity (Roadblock/LC7/MglB family)